MSLARGANYTQAGIHATLTDQFEVRDTVRISGATAGAFQPIYEDSEADGQALQRPRESGIPLPYALIALAIVFMVLLSVFLIRMNSLKDMEDKYISTNNSITKAMRDIADLESQIMLKRADNRIDYEAQMQGMIAREDTELVQIIAPNPRPYERKTTISAAGF